MEVVVTAESAAEAVESGGYAVESVETKAFQSQTATLNDLVETLPGIRIRRSGGIGSSFQYSIQGLSGRSVRFFVDGIPMDFFGRAYSVNTLPASFVDRIDVYKGVAPVELGADALGGAVNLVTRTVDGPAGEASLSYGSFDSYELTGHVQHRGRRGLTLRASALGMTTNNDYEVQGPDVVVADDAGRPVEIRARRFNDQFRSLVLKAEVGATGVPWADRFMVGMLFTDLEQGIQTGQTMRQVYGEATYAERVFVPSVMYRHDLGVPGLLVQATVVTPFKRGTTNDTSRNLYDWSGEVINTSELGGELNGGRGASRFTLTENATLGRLNLSYRPGRHHAVGLNVLATDVTRTGDDPFLSEFTTPLVDPQGLTKVVSGASYQLTAADDRLVASAFAKGFVYRATVNDSALTTTEDGTQVTVSRPIDSRLAEPGGGVAVRMRLSERVLVKASAEQTYRLPDSDEALGNGFVILNSPGLLPEDSQNVNTGVRLGRFGGSAGLRANVSGFVRWTDNLILLTVVDGQGRGQFQNVASTRGLGVEAELLFDVDRSFELSVNGTYLDVRNSQRFVSEGVENVVFGDRLRNTPYLMGNATVRWGTDALFRSKTGFFVYWNTLYVHPFFLNWPSLGASDTKDVVPAQFVSDLGASVAWPTSARGSVSLGLDLSNVFDAQAFDNFALQKPGRAVFGKLRWQN